MCRIVAHVFESDQSRERAIFVDDNLKEEVIWPREQWKHTATNDFSCQGVLVSLAMMD